MRDQIPISAREWREKRGAPEISFVSDRDKELVWKAVTDVFTFDTNDEELGANLWLDYEEDDSTVPELEKDFVQ